MMTPADSLVAVVVAAGQSRRFGTDKLFCQLGGKPVLAWSLDAFEQSPAVCRIVLVLGPNNLERGRRLVQRRQYAKIQAICPGGQRRQDSVRNGLREAAGAVWVAIHDAARPFLSSDILERGFTLARQVGAALAAVPVKDTIKIVQTGNPAHFVERTPPRRDLWAAQTPQIFRYEQLLDAYRKHGDVDVTDDAEVFERAGLPVAIFEGSDLNFKITTPGDLVLARAVARERRSA
ncbi:MAG TPA: 2-C-methyl-D-erythritol 4-phosphate cytidylyltransferase [Chloroflexota bacterium]|jgi:2-C-methyl-D-erythritol 4-phosphate cytidylyltransferase|nr:2-C-methyl-D-erythritol 4-phosphate cytidylyltransferase [Chloroflexota bacterium]